MCQTLHVNIGVDHTALKQAAFGQHRTIFGNQVVSGKDQVLRRLAKARICVQIGAQQAAGLLPDKVAAVVGFADQLVRRGQVDDDVRACLCELCRRRLGRP